MPNADLKFKIGRRLGRWLEKPRIRGRFTGRVLDYVERSYHNIGSQLEYYGELTVIDRLSPYIPASSVILDVGANHGQYAKRWLESSQEAPVISFEIDPDLHEGLQTLASSYGNRWHIELFGLSDKVGDFPIYKSDQGDELTSLLSNEESPSNIQLAHVEAAGPYLRKLNRQVFFMKVDAEGLELSILRSVVAEAIELPSVIQFEFGQTQVSSRCFLDDFFDCLSPAYELGKIYQNGVDFRSYDRTTDELFRMCNYLAVHQSRSDLIDIVSYAR